MRCYDGLFQEMPEMRKAEAGEWKGGVKMQKNLIKMLFCKHIYKIKSRLRTNRGYIVLKECEKCGRKKFDYL